MKGERTDSKKIIDDGNDSTDNDINNNSVMVPEDMATKQACLHREASRLTRMLYRRCLESVGISRGGDDCNERDFAEREADKERKLLLLTEENYATREGRSRGGGRGGEGVHGAACGQGNKLQSRVEYYRAHVRENLTMLACVGFFASVSAPAFIRCCQVFRMADGVRVVSCLDAKQGRGRPVGGRAGENDGGGADDNATVAAAGGRRRPVYLWREKQIKQFVYLTDAGRRSGAGL